MTESEKLIENETEAIDCLKSNKPTSGYLMLQEAIGMAIQALEKQIPKKPLQKSYMVKGAVVCPKCEFVALTVDEYCSHCGQKLDWSNAE